MFEGNILRSMFGENRVKCLLMFFTRDNLNDSKNLRESQA